MFTIPDAELLFQGDFKRAGNDLKIIGRDGKTFVVHDYFKTDNLHTLFAPDGAALTGDIVAALAGPLAPGEYAQATAPQGTAQPIGRVATEQGTAIAVRNGVAVTLNVGDAVFKGDVIQTQGDSKVGIIFGDGTTFDLAANARMVLNDFVYNPAPGSVNSALINLVQGSITFLAGEVAHTGDMRVGTPVATIGIRGTAVQVDIDVNNGTTQLSVLVEPGGRVGSFNVYSLSGQLIGTVNNANNLTVVTPAGPLNAVASEVAKSPAQVAQALVAVQQVFQSQSVGQAILAVQPVPPSQPGTAPPTGPDQNPTSPTSSTGPGQNPPSPPNPTGSPTLNKTQTTPTTQLASTDVSTTTISVTATETPTTTSVDATVVVPLAGTPATIPIVLPPPQPPYIPPPAPAPLSTGAVQWSNPNGGDWNTPGNWSTGSTPATTNDVAIGQVNTPVVVSNAQTVNSVALATGAMLEISDGNTFTVASGTSGAGNAGTITIDDGGTLHAGGTFANTGTIALNADTNSIHSPTQLVISGALMLTGAGQVTLSDSAENSIVSDGSPATLDNVDNTISGAGTIGDGNLTLINEQSGVIDATGTNPLILITGSYLSNAGVLEASAGSKLQIVGTNGFIDNAGTIKALDGGNLNFVNGTIENTGTIALDAISSPTQLMVSGTLTLAGGNGSSTGPGQVTLTDSSENAIVSDGSPATLYNLDNTIFGAGTIGTGDGTLTLVNDQFGVIDATGTNPLILDTGNTITNAGIFDAFNGATLLIENSVVANTGAIDVAAGSVELSNTTISGGSLSTASSGVIIATGASAIDNAVIYNSGALETGGTLTLDGSTVNGGVITGSGPGDNTINIDSSNTLTLNSVTVFDGGGGTATTDNAGTIQLGTTLTLSGSSFTLLLEGAGAVLLNGATIAATAAGETFENNGNAITGAGQIGDGSSSNLTLDNNSGTIEALGGTLTVHTGNTITNASTLEAGTNATLQIDDAVAGAGSTTIGIGAIVEFESSVSAAQTINFVELDRCTQDRRCDRIQCQH